MRHSFRLILFLFLCLFVSGREAIPVDAQEQQQDIAGAPSAEDSASASPRPTKSNLKYRMIFVPEDHLTDVVDKDEPYLSIEADEFERLLNLVRAGERGEILNPARLTQAIYRAKLNGNALVEGRAELTIVHQGTQPSVLPLEPCNLAMAAPVWKMTPQPQPAVLGSTTGTGPLAVVVEKSGELQFQWTLRGESSTPDSLQFNIDLPHTPTKQLELDLPKDQVLLSSRGVVSKIGDFKRGRQHWKLELGGQDRVSIRIVSASAANKRSRLTLLRQTANYDFSPRGVQVTNTWNMDVYHEPLTSISLTLEPTLRLVMARLAGQDIPWTATTSAETGVTSVVLQPEEPIEGVGRVLQLRAVAPLEADAPWQLPRIRSEGMFWAEGKTRLTVPEPLSLLQMNPVDCRQTSVEELSTPLVGEQIELQHFSDDAAIEVLLARKSGRLQIQQATTVDVSPTELTGRVVADFRLNEAELFSLSAEVPGEWIIDSVESVPSGALLDWNTVSIDRTKRALSVELKNAITPSSPLRLIIDGRWRRPATETVLPVHDCNIVQFGSAGTTNQFVLVRPAPALQIRTTGDATFSRLDPKFLTPTQATLFDGRWQGILYDADKVAPEAGFLFQPERARYSADILVEANVVDGILTESYSIQCIPEAARINRLLVHFSEGQGSELRWSLSSDGESQMTARKLEAGDPNIPDQVLGGETWEILLRRPRVAPLNLRAVRSRVFKEACSLSLAALPEAVSQTCQINLASSGTSHLVLRSNRLKRIPSGQFMVARSAEDRGSFTYEAERDALAPSSPAITISPAAKDALLSSAWVWNRQVESTLEGDDGTSHIARFHLENLGRSTASIRVPDEAKIQAAWVDNTPIPQPGKAGFEQTLTIELPPGRRFPVLVVHYTTPTKTPWLLGKIQAHPPSIDLPVLASSWKVWLPPGLKVANFNTISENLNWEQRLFGPLARANGETAPVTIRLGEDSIAVQKLPAEQFSKLFLSALGESIPSPTVPVTISGSTPEASPTVTWGDALRKAQATLSATLLSTQPANGVDGGPRWQVMVDEVALSAAGLSASHPILPTDLEDSVLRGLIALQTSGLALIVDEDNLILTSADTTALNTDALERLLGNSVYQVSEADRDLQLGAQPLEGALASVEQWTNRPPLPLRPWQVGRSGEAQVGWTAYLSTGSPDRLSQLSIVSKQRMTALASVSFLVVCALVWWVLPNQPSLYLSLLGACGVLALLVPASYVPLTSSLVLGTLAGGMFILLQRQLRISKELAYLNHRWDVPRGALTFGAGLIILLGSLSLSGWSWAQQPDDTSQTATSSPTAPPAERATENEAPEIADNKIPVEIFKVFVPADEELKPAGSYYLISDRLRTLLQSRAAAFAQLPPSWILTNADYQLRLNYQGMPQRLNVGEFKSTWKFRTFHQNVRVRIPLDRKQISVLAGSGRLNARPTTPQWDAAGQSILLPVPEPGEYEFSILLGPPENDMDVQSNGIDLSIPRLALSQLAVRLPSRTTDVFLPSIQGAETYEVTNGNGVVHADLGPSSQLTVNWPSSENPNSKMAQTEVEELHWLHVRPGAVELMLRCQIKVLEGRIGQVRIATDPRLRLLPMAEDSPVASVRSESGTTQTLVMELRRPISDQVTINARMLLNGSSGIGNLRLPYAQMLGAQIKQRLLAVSVDEGLAAGDPAGEALAPLAAKDYVASWGDHLTTPLLAFRLPKQDIIWSLPIRPREPKTVGTEQLRIGLGREETQVLYEAELNTESGFVFQHDLKVPGNFNVQNVEVLQEDGTDRLAHWSQETAGQVTLFLNQAVSGTHRIRLTGSLTTKLDSPWRSPQIQTRTATIISGKMQLYRTADVALDVNPGPKMMLEKNTTDEFYQLPWGRLFASYSYEKSGADALMVVSLNQPEISPASALVTRLSRKTDTWQVELDYRLRVHKGIVDVIRFDIPSSWAGPFVAETDEDIEALIDHPNRPMDIRPAGEGIELDAESPLENKTASEEKSPAEKSESSVKVQILPSSQEGRLLLVITPRKEIDDSFRVSIRGPLTVAAGERVRVPQLIPQGVEQLDQYVMLPTAIGSRRWNWTVRGLKVSAPPANLSNKNLSHSPAPTYEAYQVVADRFEAVSKATSRTTTLANVQLAEIAGMVTADGSVSGVATFDLEPAGLTECILEFPQNFRPIQLRIAGLPALSEPIGNGRWRVPLGPQQLPQRIEALFTGHIELSPGTPEISLTAPMLREVRKAIPVRRTLWTIYNSRQWGQGETVSKKDLTAIEQELIRMQSIASLMDAVEAQVANEHTPQQLELWYQSWATRLRKIHTRILRQDKSADGTSSEIAQTALALSETQEAAANRLGVAETLARLQTQPLNLVEGHELWALGLKEQFPATRADAAGGGKTLVIHFPSAVHSDLPWRLAGALLLAVAFTGLVDLSRRGWLQALLANKPYWLGILFGLGWIYFLSPAQIGWAVLFISALAGLWYKYIMPPENHAL